MMQNKKPAERISGKIYTKTAAAYVKAASIKDPPIIMRGTAQWDAWEVYWGQIGWTARHWMIDSSRQAWTVPTNWPAEFDPAA